MTRGVTPEKAHKRWPDRVIACLKILAERDRRAAHLYGRGMGMSRRYVNSVLAGEVRHTVEALDR